MAGVEVGTAYLTVVPSFKGFGSKLSSQLDSGGGFGSAGKKAGASAASGFGGSFTSGLKSVIGPAAALLGGLGAINFLKDSLGEAREAQKVGALTEQVIKTTGGAARVTADDIGKLSTAISNKTGIDDEQIQSSANMLLTFTNVKNAVGAGNDIFNQATQTITDMSAALGQDSKSSAIQLGKALNDPIKGITALQRVGVSFTQQQKDQIKTLVGSGKTLEAQKVILGELNKEFGGAAAASATAGEKMKVAFGNLKEQIGTAALPAVDKFATVMSGKVLPAISGVVGILSEGAFNGDMGFEEDSGFVTFLFNVRDGVKDIFGILKNNDANLDTTLLSPIEKFGVALIRVKDLGKVVFQQIGFGAQGMFRAFQGEGVTSDGFIGFMEQVGVAARKVFDYLKETLPVLGASAAKFWPSIKEIATQLLAASKASGISSFQILKAVFEALPGILDAILPAVQGLAKWMGENKDLVSGLVVALTAGAVAFKVITIAIEAYRLAMVVWTAVTTAAKVATVIWTGVQWALNAALFANPIGLIVLAVAALVAVIVLIATKTTWFQTIWEYTWGAIQAIVKFTWNNVLQPIINAMVTGFSILAGWVANLLEALGNVPGFEWAKTAGEKLRTASDAAAALAANIQKIPDRKTVDVDVNLAVTGGVDGVIAGVAARAGRNAAGTNFWRGGLTWVGEEGPELVSLPRGTQVLSNHESISAARAPVAGSIANSADVKGEPGVQQNFNGPIVAHDYDDFQRKMADKKRMGALAGRRA